MRASVQKVEKKDFSWLIILLLIILPIILEFVIGEKLFNASHESIISAQKFMYNSFGLKLYEYKEIMIEDKDNVINKTSNIYIFDSFLEENDDKKGSTKDILTSEIIHFINSNGFYLIICAILCNFINIYKIFILSMSIFSSNYVCSTLSYIYQSPKPYMAFYKIKSAVIFNEWASPNTQIVVLISFSLCLYQALTKNKVMEKKLWAKIVLILLLVIYCFIDIFLLFASGNCTYNHIIISVFMAISIFLIFFYRLKIDLNKSKQFYDFIKFKMLYYLVINALLFAFQILLCMFIIDERDTTFYREHGLEQISLMPKNDFSEKLLKYRNKFFLNNGNLCNCFCFLMNIVAFLSLKIDLSFIYQNNYNSWSEGNFEKPKLESINVNLDSSAVGEYSHIEESQWNHYGAVKGLLRFIILIVLTFGIYALLIWISTWSDNEAFSLIFSIIIPMAVLVSASFYSFKALFTKIKLARQPKIKSKKLAY